MRHTVLGEPGAERPARERGAVVGAQCERSRLDAAIDDGVVDDADRFLRAAANVQAAGRDLARAAVDR